MEQEPKPKRQITPEQLEALKARLLKAREAKMTRDTKRYDANKEQIKEDGLKKRTMSKIKTLVSKGAVKEEELKEILPKKEEPKQAVIDKVVEEVPFEKPLPKKRVPKAKPQPQPAVIPFEEELPPPRGTGWKYTKSAPIDIPPKPEKNRFLKLVYYKEPTKKALKKLQKLQESSSSSDSDDSDSEPEFQHAPPQGRKQQESKAEVEDDAYYRALAKKLYGGF